ncbi:tyrosine-type recombinase/integrase [Rhodococcus sp. IEGM 1379]|uniref:tyrosine-type recombinase/integrase n=1 Tax=Rhodococcus sp. IEGM 1379 TaxID=3047086 RepID=UPI0024B69F90|nr:tyrosine-type recombinase/integrase [Rhodococcus sp. IEGM 1379]MDI9914408.1 tyrosine-type recombinase/integrase [Rhodococcus sp. IEGM 1379]
MATVKAYDTAAGRRYRVRYRTPQGKQTDKRGFTTKKAAEAWANNVEVDKLKGIYVSPSAGKTTVVEMYEQWKPTKLNLAPSSLRRYELTWEGQIAPEWRDVKVADLTATSIEVWLAKLVAQPLSPTTVKKAHQLLSMLLDLAVRDYRIQSNPAKGLTLPRIEESEPTFLTSQQVIALSTYAKHGKLTVLILGFCGLRWGEMAALKVHRWDEKRRRLRIVEQVTEIDGKLTWGPVKNHQARSVSVPRFVADEINLAIATKDPVDLVCPAAGGGVMRNKNARRDWFDDAVTESNVPKITPHDLRHSAASIGIAAGANLKGIQTMLGHKTATMTLDLYGHLFDDHLDDVADKIDAAVLATSGVTRLDSKRA